MKLFSKRRKLARNALAEKAAARSEERYVGFYSYI